MILQHRFRIHYCPCLKRYGRCRRLADLSFVHLSLSHSLPLPATPSSRSIYHDSSIIAHLSAVQGNVSPLSISSPVLFNIPRQLCSKNASEHVWSQIHSGLQYMLYAFFVYQNVSLIYVIREKMWHLSDFLDYCMCVQELIWDLIVHYDRSV